MRCAKCGKEVSADAETCPWCAAGYRADFAAENRVCCPQCGSTDLSAVRRTFDPGCGCLGLLVFGWIGLLLGLLGAGKVDLVCRNCGTTWEAGKKPGTSVCGAGCFSVILLVLAVILLKKLLFC